MSRHIDFIQIGAHVGKTRNDPVKGRVAKGQTGILVEPVPFLFRQLVSNYTDHGDQLKFVNKAISSKPGELTLYVPSPENDFSRFPFYASQLASVIPGHIEKHLPKLKVIRIAAPSITLPMLLEEHRISRVDSLFMDTEGHDFDILMSLDLENFRPDRIHFENKHMDGTNRRGERYHALLDQLSQFRYRVVKETHSDTTVLSAETLGRKNLLIDRIIESKRAMVNRQRLLNLNYWCEKFSGTGVSFVECGVAQGGSLALMADRSRGNPVYGFDSFEGMPELTAEDQGSGERWVNYNCSRYGEQAVADTFEKLDVDVHPVRLVRGYFEDSLPSARKTLGAIGVLRLDNDWYRSTRYCLEQLYQQVVPGGVVIIDDYGTFTGCRKAVDEFRAQNRIESPLVRIDNKGEHYWIKDIPGQPVDPEQDKNTNSCTLIYCSIFINTDYVKLLNLLLISLAIHRGNEPFKLLIITDEKIRQQINATTIISLFEHDYMILDCETVFQSAYNRLKVFDYPEIDLYQKILYLDLDILISASLDTLLAIGQSLIPDKLSAMREGSILKKFWGGSFFFTREELRDFESLDGFCSGVLMFRNHKAIRELFSDVLDDIEVWKRKTDYIPSLLEQPFLNHRTARRGQRELDLLEGLITMNPESQDGQVISHFAGGPGKSGSKLHKMNRFMKDILLPGFLSAPAEPKAKFQEFLSGCSYHWLHDRETVDGKISFQKDGGLKTSWSTGRWKASGDRIVIASWSGYTHILLLSQDRQLAHSVRTSDLNISLARICE